MNVAQVLRDQNLIGHTLISLPEKIYTFSQGEFCLYDRPDPGTRSIHEDHLIAKVVSYCKGRCYIIRTEVIGEKPLLDIIEFVSRRILGSCFAAISFLTLFPLGLIAKVLHLSARSVSNLIAASDLAQRISQIWNDASLFGHALTSAPSKCRQFATTPLNLNWHLRANGTDRRACIVTYGPNGPTLQKSEYELVPFELFEFVYRRVLGGALTLTASLIAPLGLVAKSIHALFKS